MHKLSRPEFPLSLHALQADIRCALDRLSQRSSSESSNEVKADTPYPEGVCLEDDVDVEIRLAFSEFLLGNDMLGLIEAHMGIYRLFPRPVVSLKLSSFLKSYSSNERFMKMFIKSQVGFPLTCSFLLYMCVLIGTVFLYWQYHNCSVDFSPNCIHQLTK